MGSRRSPATAHGSPEMPCEDHPRMLDKARKASCSLASTDDGSAAIAGNGSRSPTLALRATMARTGSSRRPDVLPHHPRRTTKKCVFPQFLAHLSVKRSRAAALRGKECAIATSQAARIAPRFLPPVPPWWNRGPVIAFGA